jgi:putative ABC transport system permease protein
MTRIWQDIRFGLRSWRSTPGFTITAILCLALGIGATTAIFSVVNAVLVRPLPYKDPDRLARIYTEFPTFPNGGLPRFWVSGPEFLDFRRDTHSWESLDAWQSGGFNIVGATQPVRVTGSAVTGTLMPTLGIAPILGRTIQPEDDSPKSPLTVVISSGVWHNAYGGDPHIVGRDTLIDGEKATIIGVMPQGFAFPPGELDASQIWVPMRLDPAKPGNRGGHNYNLVGRLKPNVSIEQASSEFAALVKAAGDVAVPDSGMHSFHPKFHTVVTFPLHAEVARNVRPALMMLLGAVGFVLLIACVNVANLLLARAEARRREVAIRGALGAGRLRLVQQFATEGVLLSVVGAALGMGIAVLGLRLIQLTNAGAIPRAGEINVDWNVLGFTVLVAVATGLIFGVAPVISLLLGDFNRHLHETATSTTGSGTAAAFRRFLVAGELALALVLLIGCGLMVRAFWKLQKVEVGFNPDHVLSLQLELPSATYKKPEDIDGFWQRLLERINGKPGVQIAAIAYGLPPLRRPNMNDTKIEGFQKREGGPVENVDFYQYVSPSYFQTMGIRLMQGRFLEPGDSKGAPDVAVINRALADTFWPGQNPIGRRVQPGEEGPWCTVVGVVENTKNAGIDQPAGTELYLPFNQKQAEGYPRMNALLRTNGNPLDFVGMVRREVQAMDSSLPLAKIMTMEEVVADAQSRPRFLTILLSLFSVLAFLIATIGIYGVMSYTVARRTKEFGLRMALGAQTLDVVKLVMRQGVIITIAGIAAGLLGAFIFTRFMTRMLYQIGATDPMTYVGVTAALVAVALLACYVPARRATRVDPAITLHYE